MSSTSDDEQDDDNNIFDQLKSIKAFTVDQLYLLHPDVGCPTSKSTQGTINDNKHNDTNNQSSVVETYHDQNLYQNLIDYEQLRDKLYKLKTQVKYLNRTTFDHVEKVWTFKEEAPRKIGMCQQGKIAETTFRYKQAFIDTNQLNVFDLSFDELVDLISKDYIYYSFESQMKRHRIATQLSISYKLIDFETRKSKLKLSITTLVNFIRHLGDSKSDFVLQCRKWLRGLIKRYLEEEEVDDYKYIIAQLCKGPAGTADWSSDLIEYKPFGQLSEFESTPQYITNCSALLSELFNNLKDRIKKVTIATGDSTYNSSESEQNWSLLDPRFSCSEELSSAGSGNTLSESDVIKFCLRIPVAKIFRAYVKGCLQQSREGERDKNYESIMLKLLTIGTVIIKTYQIGLETFDSIQFGNLIEYLSSQIRQTVIILSDQWNEFKRRLKGIDNALLMRLQVEYDNFILRSILIILELRQSGIWRHLSRIEPEDLIDIDIDTMSWSAGSIRPAFAKLLQVTGLTTTPTTSSPSTIEIEAKINSTNAASKSSNSLTYEFSIEWFKEVSEPMLWHILWQFYHNAFVSSCDYHSDNYWLEKFRENSVVYLFVNKIKDSAPGECSYLINSVTSMLLSRTNTDSKFVSFVATELFNISFRHKDLKEKITKKGIRSLIKSAEKFPHLISLYLSFILEIDDDDIVVLFRGCSLTGWLCNSDEFKLIASWLVESPLTSAHNKIARIIISKLLLNSRESTRNRSNSLYCEDGTGSIRKISKRMAHQSKVHCFVDLKLRRQLALLLYEASVRHLPENNDYKPLSFGASVEVAFGTLFCEKNSTAHHNLLELAIDTNYQQFYVWIWRLLFTFKLHILNQPETDWNDVKSRSGTSRSIVNTVLVNDSFHPVPTIQDSEFLPLSEGIKNQNPMASFLFLLMTDVTWQSDTLDSCLNHLNLMAQSGHLTPSLMAMEFLTICHLNDLSETMAKDSRCFEYFTTIINSNFDSTRLASLIISQMQNLKQYRQLQLSQFYITVLLEVSVIILKQLQSSWFSSDEHKLEKIACLLDYIVKFNFPTQRLEIKRKFYDCSYSIQSCKDASSWLGSFFSTSSLNVNSTKREFITTAHVLAQKFKKFSWLRWVTTECDTLRLEKIWEDIVLYLSTNEEANLDAAIKKVCPQVNSAILKATIPIYSWKEQIFDLVESDLNHPLCPLIWYNFFSNYFANSLNGVSVGLKLITQDTLTRLLSRLDSLINYHLYKHRNWTNNNTNNLKQNSLAQLYRAYRLWLQDTSLQNAYVDMDRLREDYLVSLLKAIMESSTEDACLQYIDIHGIETQNRNLSQIWSTATLLEGNNLIKDMIFVKASGDQNESMEILTNVADNEAASDATSLINIKSTPLNTTQHQSEFNAKSLAQAEDEFKTTSNSSHLRFDALSGSGDQQQVKTIEEIIQEVKKNCQLVFEESTIFGNNIQELEKLKSEIIEIIQQLYVNKKAEHIRVIPCADGSECIGPARIKFEVEEATIDDRKSECIQDRQRQCDGLIEELLPMPSNQVVSSSIMIEDSIKEVVKDSKQVKFTIESLLSWISEPITYNQLNGSYYTANHLLKTILDILSNTDEIETYNSTLIDVCLEHPGSVQIFSPYLKPKDCAAECFLNLYEIVSSSHDKLGPMASFVLLSKFDLQFWLERNHKNKTMLHKLIKTTCSALSGMGKKPDDSFMLTYDIYKRHIQVQFKPPYYRQAQEVSLLLGEFLAIMDQQKLAPTLWAEFLMILGLEKQVSLTYKTSNNKSPQKPQQQANLNKSGNNQLLSTSMSVPDFIPLPLDNVEHDESTIANVIEDIARLADCQTIFDYQALNDMMQIISSFIKEKDFPLEVTLLEHYQDYINQFSVVMLSVTFMWLKTIGAQYPDNHNLIWRQLMDVWYHWVFLTKNCQNVGKANYSLLANEFVASLRYMLQKIPDNTQMILQSILQTLADYVRTTKEVVYLELTILQRCLKNLPWSSLLASPNDFENLAILSEQENYNISDLTSHILLQINTKDSLNQINETDPAALPQVAERLATTLVLQSNQLKGFRLYGGYFTLIPVNKISEIARLIMPKMEFANLEHSQNNKLLVNLLRFMCIKLDDSQCHITDSFDRAIIYAKFVSNYLVTLIKSHPAVIKYHRPYIFAVMDNSLQDLKILLSPDVEILKKTAIYESLLECCSSRVIDENSRMTLAKSLIKSSMLKNRPIVVMEVFNAIGQIINDPRVLVYTIEKMINLYLNMNGYYEKVWKSFNLKVLPSDLYLEACIDENVPLALLVYFEALIHNGQDNHQASTNNHNEPLVSSNNKIWSSFFHWVSKLSIVTHVDESNEVKSNDVKLAIAWIRLLDLFEPNLIPFIHSGFQKIITTNSSPNTTTTSSSEAAAAEKVSLNESKSSSSVLNEKQQNSITAQQTKSQSTTLIPSHRTLLDFIKQLITMYESCNASGLWYYLKFSRNEQTSRINLIALSIACFLADRTLTCLKMTSNNGQAPIKDSSDQDSASITAEEVRVSGVTNKRKNSVVSHLTIMRDEIRKLRKSCLTKLEAARKSKYYLDDAQFIEALIESVNQNDKVQYCDGIQLITTFVKAINSTTTTVESDDCVCISKILPSFTE